jgi:hypothetical protein
VIKVTIAQSEESLIRKAIFQFIFPFSLAGDCQDQLRKSLLQDGFVAFKLGDLELENAFYGPDNRASHRDMERYYLPFTNHVLFPSKDDPDAFRRLSKAVSIEAKLHTQQVSLGFKVHSMDLFLCPFNTGFLTLRMELGADQETTFSQAIEFGDRMRHLQDTNKLDLNTYVEYDGKNYGEVEEFVFQVLAPHLLPFLDPSLMEGTYFEKLPFLMDDRMFVIGFCVLPEDSDITVFHQYRAGRLDGLDLQGKPRIGASHPHYIEQYCQRFVYDRWAPNTYYITDETCFMGLTCETTDIANRLENQMYGEYYYGLMLNLFHRIVLLKLSISYSQVQLERKQEHTESLIRDITSFSAKYYFVEIVSQTQGREIFHQLRAVYGNDELFEDVKQTLNDLYKYQETRTSKQSSYLLTILTIYTVISGIYGMNQVIEDLKGNFTWAFLRGYSSFQWIALAVTFSGLAVAFLLVIGVTWKWGGDFIRRRRK